MERRFTRHYTRDQARALLPEVRRWLKRLRELRALGAHLDGAIEPVVSAGHDVGGDQVGRNIRVLGELHELLRDIRRREIQIKELDRGLVDFPAILSGREVFLCWEEGEDDIEFWHDLDAGYVGRSPL